MHRLVPELSGSSLRRRIDIPGGPSTGKRQAESQSIVSGPRRAWADNFAAEYRPPLPQDVWAGHRVWRGRYTTGHMCAAITGPTTSARAKASQAGGSTVQNQHVYEPGSLPIDFRCYPAAPVGQIVEVGLLRPLELRSIPAGHGEFGFELLAEVFVALDRILLLHFALLHHEGEVPPRLVTVSRLS